MRNTSKFPDNTKFIADNHPSSSNNIKYVNEMSEPVILTDKDIGRTSKQRDPIHPRGDELKLHMLFKETKDYIDSSDPIDTSKNNA